MGYTDRVVPTSAVFGALTGEILEDMDGGEGVAWWEGISTARNLLVADYTLGLVQAVTTNLAIASMHLARRLEVQSAADVRLRSAMTRTLSPQAPMSADYSDLALEADGHFAGFLRALGSTVDSLGALVVATTGMGTNVVRASWSVMMGWNAERTTGGRKGNLPQPHRDLIDDVMAQIASAVAKGPTDWLDWSIDFRNTVVHRAPRATMNLLGSTRSKGMSHPLPAHPARTQAEALSRGRKGRDDFAGRETTDTFELLFVTLLDLAQDVGDVCLRTWRARREDSALHLQQKRLWPDLLQGREARFTGAGTTPPLGHGSRMGVAGSSSRRLVLTRVLDDDVYAWRQWIREDERDN